MLLLVVVVLSASSSTASHHQTTDWLVGAVPDSRARVVEACWDDDDDDDDDAKSSICGLDLTNSIVSRRFALSPAFGTVDWLLNATAQHGGLQSMFRAVQPEARLRIDGVDFFVGCLDQTSGFRAYWKRRNGTLEKRKKNCLSYVRHRVRKPRAPFRWVPGTRGSPKTAKWPPEGIALEVDFAAAAAAADDELLEATVFYELYDGAPIMSKWLEVRRAAKGTTLEAVDVELFDAMPRFGAYFPHGSFVPGVDSNGASSDVVTMPQPLLFAKTDQAHGAACTWTDNWNASNIVVEGCESCDHDRGGNEPLLNCTSSPGVELDDDDERGFESFRVMVVAIDSPELERFTLSRHRLVQLLAPHAMENPVFFHATDVSVGGFERVVDQMSEVGFEMLIESFGSGFNLESTNATYVNLVASQVAYANARGIEVGGYDLIVVTRGVSPEWTAVNADGTLSNDACFASGWADHLEERVHAFIDETNISMLETDGPYGGEVCASTNHSHHKGLKDSVYQQSRRQSQFFRKLRDRGLYLNQPDEYFFQGGSRTGMGYDEQQYSLPRWEDLTLSRMGLYDDLYKHLPTQGWMFVPIIVYHAGSDAAAFDNRSLAFEWALAQYLGAGTAACYRGPHLWADDLEGRRIKAILLKWVAFYKAHRQTLVQPVVHLRRPDAFSWDGFLHVHPLSPTAEVGVALIFNPTTRRLNIQLRLPLYYCGLDDEALLTLDDDPTPARVKLARDYSATLLVDAAPLSIHTVIVARPTFSS
ncbi:hypothetical protein CTAYLR_004168 [Chrysophaeum taylorii]|uniref:Alpha-galactosidase n=1 Tax=Chrysophaeum taylorii TaxID=2483200 RepID=A0AAD7UNC2_9STRA|nr:hypothetical protein CTAYLR_004168 [Chrysophaeum taylorii]